MKKTILTVIAVLLIAMPVRADEPAVAEDYTQQVEGFNLSGYTDGGQKSWDINGDTADISQQKIKIKNVDANSYGEQNVNVKAKTGVLDKDSGNVKLQEDVVITSEQGTKMTTDSLNWNRNKDLVTTQDPVVIKDKGIMLKGTGMVAQPNLKTAELKEDVIALVETVNQEKETASNKVTITCDGPMEVDQAKQMATFNTNVVVIEKSTGRELKGDKIDVYFDQKNKKIVKMIASGNVSVKQDGNTTYSEQLVYDAAQQKMTLSGRPKLILDMEDSGESGGFFESLGQ